LARQDVCIAGHSRVIPQMPGKHLSDGELGDLTGPGAHHVLRPPSAVWALVSQ
jgi:hypothetical protein